MNLAEAFTELARVSSLQPNWDDEGADPPNATAIWNAVRVVEWAMSEPALRVRHIAADVMGGVGVYIHQAAGGHYPYAWVSLDNDGDQAVIVSIGDVDRIWSSMWTPDAQAETLGRLRGDKQS